MLLPNPRNESLGQLLPLVQSRYPAAVTKKVLLSPEAIFIPQNGFKFVLRKTKKGLKIDHTLPVLWSIGAVLISVIMASFIMSLIFGQFMFGIGGALWVVLGIFLMKYLFSVAKKDQFEAFRTELSTVIGGFDFERQTPHEN